MRALLVVGEAEGVELALEPGEAAGCRPLPEPPLEGLVETLDLALGLRVTRCAVLLTDAEVGEQVLEAVAAPGEARRVDRPIVGERGGGPTVGVAGRGKRGHHVVAADTGEGGAGQQVAGVVIEPVDDLDLPVGEAPVGEVGLPYIVGCGGLEPDPGAARALVRLGHDEAGGSEDAPDGRDRRNGQALALEVLADCGRAGVEASGDKVRSEFDDPVAHGDRRPLRARMWPPGSGFEGFEPTFAVPAEEPVQVAPTNAALGCRGGDG
jgi:hypothetical protein